MSQYNLAQILAGSPVPPMQRIKIFSPDEWEEFVEEWLTVKKKEFLDTDRLGGAGDKGRDVVGYVTCPKQYPDSYVWDNFQCKHYDHPLMPSDVWAEFGKLCYYTFIGDFPVPRYYFFVAPQGLGTSLSDLLRKPTVLKTELKANWDKYCKHKITKTVSGGISLEGDLLKYIDEFDFSIFYKMKPLTLVEEHAKSRYHATRFGGGLPDRPNVGDVPQDIASSELVYISKLLDAYSEADNAEYIKVSDLPKGKATNKHFKRARKNFHKAEQLKQFSRDTLPPGIFEKFQGEISSGVVDIVDEEHENGFVRVKTVEKEARRLAITSNPLTLCSDGEDRAGICHHLANDNSGDNEFVWVAADDD